MENTQTVSTKDAISSPAKAPKLNYNSIRDEVELPLSERKRVLTRNGREVVHRKYHLTEEQKTQIVEKHKAMGGGSVINPLAMRAGVSFSQVESLIRLGSDKWHSHKSVRDMMEKIMSVVPAKVKLETGEIIDTDAWTAFYTKAPRVGATKPKDGDGKIINNFEVLQRLVIKDENGVENDENNPYGYKLAQFNMCVDIKYDDTGVGAIPYFRLNTEWEHEDDVRPIYGKKPKVGKC